MKEREAGDNSETAAEVSKELFWQTKTRRAPATARAHTNYQVTHMTSTASCHVLIKSGYPTEKFIPSPSTQGGALGHFNSFTEIAA